MRLINVDMTNQKIEEEDSHEIRLLGGRAIIDQLLTKYMDPQVHPLSRKSYFIVANGLLAGTNAPNSGRLSIGGKSPLTGTIKEANSGGTAGYKLGRLGVRAIMVTGGAKEKKILVLSKTRVSLEDGSDIAGLGNYKATEILRDRYGNKTAIILAGPAGEMGLCSSTVAVTDLEGKPSRHAARGGLGAVMASKGLKAIVIDDSGCETKKGADPEGFKAAVKAAIDAIMAKPTCQHLSKLGTPMWVDTDQTRGSMPTFNYRAGAFDGFQKINGITIADLAKNRGGKMGHGCMPGCVVRCSHTFNGPDKEFVTSSLEYETIAMLGANLGIDDIDSIARMDRHCDDLGIDTIEAGAAIGILNDVGLFTFGDFNAAEAKIDEIAKGSPLGRIIGNGVHFTAQAFGIDRVPAVKRQAIPAHSARSVKGWGVTYATSPQGADHSAGPVGVEPLSNHGHAERSLTAQIQMAALDSVGICWFTFIYGAPNLIVPMINTYYGINWTEIDYLNMGRTVLRQEIAFNLKAGISLEGNGLPEWLREEVLPPKEAIFDVSKDDIHSIFSTL